MSGKPLEQMKRSIPHTSASCNLVSILFVLNFKCIQRVAVGNRWGCDCDLPQLLSCCLCGLCMGVGGFTYIHKRWARDSDECLKVTPRQGSDCLFSCGDKQEPMCSGRLTEVWQWFPGKGREVKVIKVVVEDFEVDKSATLGIALQHSHHKCKYAFVSWILQHCFLVRWYPIIFPRQKKTKRIRTKTYPEEEL